MTTGRVVVPVRPEALSKDLIETAGPGSDQITTDGRHCCAICGTSQLTVEMPLPGMGTPALMGRVRDKLIEP
jgi:hypothetical protein